MYQFDTYNFNDNSTILAVTGVRIPSSAQIIEIMEIELRNKYECYLWRCYNNGDLWALKYRPFTFDEWLENGCPDEIGYEIKKKE